MKKTVICITETSKAYFIIEHDENEDPVKLFTEWNDGTLWKDMFIQQQLDDGYQGADVEIAKDFNQKYIDLIPSFTHDELTGEEE